MTNLLPGESLTDWIRPGVLATWVRIARGGYGYAEYIPAKVDRVHDGTVTIVVTDNWGFSRKRRVRLTSLKPRATKGP